jgi:hypothetical protein
MRSGLRVKRGFPGMGMGVGRVKRGGLRRSGFVPRGCCYGESALSICFFLRLSIEGSIWGPCKKPWRESLVLAATVLESYQLDDADPELTWSIQLLLDEPRTENCPTTPLPRRLPNGNAGITRIRWKRLLRLGRLRLPGPVRGLRLVPVPMASRPRPRRRRRTKLPACSSATTSSSSTRPTNGR